MGDFQLSMRFPQGQECKELEVYLAIDDDANKNSIYSPVIKTGPDPIESTVSRLSEHN